MPRAYSSARWAARSKARGNLLAISLPRCRTAQENLEVHRDNYNSGLNNLSDLLDAQRLQQEAKTELVNAFAKYQNSQTTYLYRNSKLESPSLEKLTQD